MKNLALGKNTESPVFFKAGTVIFAQGDNSPNLILVKRGFIRLMKSNSKNLSVFKICKDKEILNEVSVLTSQPITFSAIAKTDVELVFIEQKDILTVLKSGPNWIPEMFETLCDRLISTETIIDEHNLLAGEKSPEFLLTKDEERACLEALAEYRNA